MVDTDIRDYIINWNLRFPMDYRWRKKYNIPFNSVKHRESCFLDQLIDLEEDKFFQELLSEEDEYRPGSGDWLKHEISDSIEDELEMLREESKSFLKEFGGLDG